MSPFRHLLGEIHRRSIWQVLGIYLAGGWLAYQVVLDLVEGLGLPDWTPPVAVALLVVGLPIVLATAFVREDAAAEFGGAGRPDTRPTQRAGAPQPGAPAPRADATLAREGDARLHVGLGTLLALAFAAVAITRILALRYGLPDWLWQGAAALMTLVVLLAAVVEWRAWRSDRSWLTDRRAFLAAGAGLLVVTLSGGGYVTSRALGVGPFATPIARGELAAKVRVVLAEFVPVGVDSALAGAAAELLRTDLQQSRTIHALSWSEIADALARMERDSARLDAKTATELAQREGVPAIVTGELRRVGAQFLLLASLTRVSDGTLLLSQRETARDSSDLIAAAERLSRRLRVEVGESLRGVRASAPLPRVTTGSLEALSLYAEAVRLAAVSLDFQRARELLEQAVIVDTTFAAAHRKLAALYLNSPPNPMRARDASEMAYRFRDRLPLRERLLVEETFHHHRGENARAEAALRRMFDLDPDDADAFVNLSDLRLRERRFSEAESLAARAIARGHHTTVALWNALEAQVAQGRFAAADSLLVEEWARAYPGLRARVLLAKRDFAAVQSVLDSTGLQWPHAALQQGRVAEAERTAGGQTTVGWLRARLRYGGDTAAISRALDARLRQIGWDTIPRRDRGNWIVVTTLAELGRTADARREMARWQAEAPDDPNLAEYRDLCIGSIASADEDFESAVAAFLGWHEAPFFSSVHWFQRGLAEAGAAFDRLGRPDTAIALYERALQPDLSAGDGYDLLWYPFVLRRLGELHEARGHTAQAVDYYTRFIELWKDADPHLQPQVRAARAARDRLVARSG